MKAWFHKTLEFCPLHHVLSLYLPPGVLWGYVRQDGDETG